MSTNYAQQWKQRIAAGPADPGQLVEATFAGFTGLFRRLPLQAWVRSGRLPFFFVEEAREAVEATQGRTPKEAAEELRRLAAEKPFTKERFDEGVRVTRDIVTTVCVDPKIVTHDGELAEGEIRYSEFALEAPEVIETIMGWAMMGSPNIPVNVIPGMEVTSLADLASFRESKRRPAASRPGSKVPSVRRATKRRARNKR